MAEAALRSKWDVILQLWNRVRSGPDGDRLKFGETDLETRAAIDLQGVQVIYVGDIPAVNRSISAPSML